MVKFFSIATFCGCVFLFSACVTREASPAAPSDDAELVQGQKVYNSKCASCHGSAGEGGVGLQLNEGAVLAAYPEFAAQVALVKEGRDAMPAFADSLSEEEIKAVTRYTREVLE